MLGRDSVSECFLIMWETKAGFCQVSCREHVSYALLVCYEIELHVCVGSVVLSVLTSPADSWPN